MQFVEACVSSSLPQLEALPMLGLPQQAVLGRKLVVPEVYDLMGQVQKLMVRSQAAPVRQSCSAVRHL